MYNQEPAGYACPFCRMLHAGLDTEQDVVFESAQVFACIALHQHQGSGPSLLVMPKRHVENIYDLSDELLADVSRVSKHIAIHMRELWHIQGITLWQHNEAAGFQDVWHFHMHIKGRLDNDRLLSAPLLEMPPQKRHALARELKQHMDAQLNA